MSVPADYEVRPKAILLQVLNRDYYLHSAQELLALLPVDIRVVCLVNGTHRAAVEQWLKNAPIETARKERVCFVAHERTSAWARDNFILGTDADGRFVFVVSGGKNLYEVKGVERERDVVGVLERFLETGARDRDAYAVHRGGIYFSGGDLLRDERIVVVSENTIASNMDPKYFPDSRAFASREDLLATIEKMFDREVVVVPSLSFQSDVDAYITFVGGNRVIVGDMALPRATMTPEELHASFPDPGQLLRRTREYFRGENLSEARDLGASLDSMASTFAALGYEVLRIPWLPYVGQEAPYLTYNNVLFLGPQEVIMPVYGVVSLDELAERIYRQMGIRVIPVNMRGLSQINGSLRCMTNILAW